MGYFDGFALEHLDVGEGVTLRVRHGGEGPPVVLLHGHPRTHATWHMVADRLAPHHTVVCPDLRGYGESSKIEPYTKRAMAGDVVRLMRTLGHERFHLVGHDRGAYVATRLALDSCLRCPRDDRQGRHCEGPASAGGTAVPAMFFNALQNHLGNGHRVAAGNAVDTRRAPLENRAHEIALLFLNGITRG